MYSIARSHRGYSLLEIVIVVMIVGLIATIAAPKLLGTSQQAVENGLRHSLSVIRAAIDSYSAENNGLLPGANGDESTFKANLANYLRGEDFPSCPIGAAKNNKVHMVSGAGAVISALGDTEMYSWVYNYETGDFHANSDTLSVDGDTKYVKF
jgi:general secretion pathway protein G